MKTKRLWVNIIAACLLLALGAISATAQSQITLANSTQVVTFTATSVTTMNIALGSCSGGTFTGTCTLSGSAFFPGDTGSPTYSFTTTTAAAFTATKFGTSTVFPITTPGGATSTFSYAGGTDSLSGTVTWTNANNGSGNPHFTGIITVTASSGTAAFTSLFGVGSTPSFDLLLSALTCTGIGGNPCTLEGIFASGSGSANAPDSAGQVQPVPEPGSMLLLGSGLLVAGSFLRRRRRV